MHDPFEREEAWDDSPQQAAFEILVRWYGSHPRTWAIVRDRAQHDPNPRFRKWAQKQLRRVPEHQHRAASP